MSIPKQIIEFFTGTASDYLDDIADENRKPSEEPGSKRNVLSHIENLDDYLPRVAKTLNNLSRIFLYLGKFASAGRMIPIHPVPLVSNAFAQIMFFLGYAVWRGALALDQHNLKIKQNELGQDVQHLLTKTKWHRRAATFGMLAAITVGVAFYAAVGIVTSALLGLGAWIYSASSGAWAKGEASQIKALGKNPTPEARLAFKKQTYYAAYSRQLSIGNLVIAVGATLSLIFPPLAATITIASILIASVPLIRAGLALLQHHIAKRQLKAHQQKVHTVDAFSERVINKRQDKDIGKEKTIEAEVQHNDEASLQDTAVKASTKLFTPMRDTLSRQQHNNPQKDVILNIKPSLKKMQPR